MTSSDLQAVPAAPSDVDDAFLSAALGFDVRVVGREPVGEGIGQAGQVVRLRLEGPAPAPESVVLKMPPAAAGNRAVGRAFDIYRREVEFNRRIAPNLPIRVPHCHWAAVDPATGATALLQEDLGEWLTVSQIQGADAGRARQVVDSAARLHAWAWEPTGPGWWPERLDDPPYDQLGPAYRASVPGFLDRLGHVLPVGSAAACERIGDRYEDLVADAMRAPITLCHGDYRLDNLLFDDADTECAVLDWQLPCLGPAAADLAMFLTQSLDPAVRAAHEHELIGHWHKILTRCHPTAAAASPAERAFADYRRLAMYATMIPVLCGAAYDLTNPRAMELFETLARRGFTAVLNLDSLALIS